MSSAPSLAPAVRPAVGRPEACAACPHALAAHDRISLRFCQATQASAATRGCVCPSA
jgi:hypothetical protein